jgi:hypothetical protein
MGGHFSQVLTVHSKDTHTLTKWFNCVSTSLVSKHRMVRFDNNL